MTLAGYITVFTHNIFNFFLQKLQKQLQKEKDGEKKNQLEYLVRRMVSSEF